MSGRTSPAGSDHGSPRSDARREALRRRLVEAIPSWYSPWLHLAVPSLFGLCVLATCLWLLEPIVWWELLVVPLAWVASNASEWHAHKHLLHHRSRWAPVLYDRHTPEHHRVYVTDDMAMRSNREFRLVLIPAYGVFIIFVGVAIPAAAVWLAGWRNVAYLFVATDIAYTLSYEWLHLAYHLRTDHPIGRLRWVAKLRHHHAVHHDPALMQRWNFNVTVPLWDHLAGTVAPPRDSPPSNAD